MLSGEPCDLTQGIQMWDFLHIDDATSGIAALIERDVPAGVYNFGSGKPRVLREYLDEMKRLTASDSVLNYGAVPYPETGMVTIQPDITKMAKITGWNPQITFEQGITDIIKRMRAEMK
jgi:nucleoside-diphosphate-sugar epimerase